MKSTMGMLLGLAMLVPAVSFAADLTAEQIVTKVSQTYSGLRSFRFVEEHVCRTPTDPALGGYSPPGPLGDRPARFETDLAVSTPGRIRLDVSSGEGEVLLVSDGLKTWTYIPDRSARMDFRGAPLLQELWANPIRFISDDLALYMSLSHEAGRAKLRGEETLSLGGQNVRCYVVHVPAPSGSRTLWVDEQRFLVLRDDWLSAPGSIDLSNPNRAGFVYAGDWTSRLEKADLGPMSDDTFQLAIPGSAPRGSTATGGFQFREISLPAILVGLEMEQGANQVQFGSTFSEMQRGGDIPGAVYSLLGTKARDFTLGGVEGENVRLDGLRGKIVVLDFWASWCQPCQEELAAIQKLHEELASKGVVFLGIDEESPETVKTFAQAGGYTFPMLLDSKQTVHGLYGVRLAPTTVVIDRKGKITAHLIGAASEAQLRQALTAAGLDTTKP